MPHPENFWSQYTGLGTQTSQPKTYSSTLPKSFFFYKTDKFIYFVLSSVKVGHLRRLPLNEVFHKKYTTAISTLMYHSCLLSNMQQVIWTFFIHGLKLLISIQNSYWGMNCYQTFFIISVEKKSTN